MCTYRTVEWHRQCAVVISWYSLMLSRIEKNFRGRRRAHYAPNIAHFKLLLRSDENTFPGKSCNAVSLRVPNTWPPNCAHVVLIHSIESPVRYFMKLLLFHVQTLFNLFTKYGEYLIEHICVKGCFHSWNEKNLRNTSMNRYTVPVCHQ